MSIKIFQVHSLTWSNFYNYVVCRYQKYSFITSKEILEHLFTRNRKII